MIRKIECYVAVCDVCGKLVDADAEFTAHWDTEADALEHALTFDYGASCEMIDGKLCCPSCYEYDDDDELVIRLKESE